MRDDGPPPAADAASQPRPRAAPALSAPPIAPPAVAGSASRVLRLAVFGVLAVLALGLVSAWQLYRQVLLQTVGDAQRAAQILDEHAAKVIGGHLASAQQIDWLTRTAEETAAPPMELHERLRAIRAAIPEIQSIWLFDEKGDVRATDVSFPPPAVNFSDRDYFQAASRGERNFIGRVILGRLTKDYSFTLARRLTAPGGGFGGVLVVSLAPEYFQRFYSSIGKRASVMLVRDDGALLARHPWPADPTTAELDAGFMRRLSEGEAGWFRGASALEKEEHVFAHRRLSGLPLFVVYGTPLSVVRGEWLRLVGLYGLIAAPALLGLVLFGAAGYRQAQIADRSRLELREANLGLEARVERRTRELRESEAHMRILALEVDHRAKNLLATAQSIAALTRAPSLPDFRTRLLGRLAALGHAQSLLSEGRWAGASLRRLAEEELAPYRTGEAQRIQIDGPDLMLAPAAAQAVSMVFHELATNAAKYGALAQVDGRVLLEWSRPAAEELLLRWRETGVELAAPPHRTGFGAQLIETTCAHQLGGRVAFDWLASGLFCELVLPASVLAQDTPAAGADDQKAA